MNTHEAAARARKVSTLGAHMAHLIDDATTVDVLRRLDDTGRRAIAEIAGVHPPSDETWELACDSAERIHALAAADPFAGLAR